MVCLEQLEVRVVPSTNVTAYHQASPIPSPPSTIGAGVNSNETILTPANVNATDFGKLFATTVDGQVYAQPLYMENVNITTGSNQGTHNVVFVATEHDSLYAIDANTGTILWQDALLTPEHGGTVTSVPNSAVSSERYITRDRHHGHARHRPEHRHDLRGEQDAGGGQRWHALRAPPLRNQHRQRCHHEQKS